MRIIIAPNAFKNSLPAEEVASAIQQGLLASALKCECVLFPIGDGGDGTGSLLTRHLGGEQRESVVCDPLGRMIKSSFGWIEETKTAIIEMAAASGLHLIQNHELNPLTSTSYGTGEMIRHALDMGAHNIFLAVGGSATTDGGCGILKALGARFLKYGKQELVSIPKELPDLVSIDLSQIDRRIDRCSFTILCDVINPIIGKNGSARIFGPQKGASQQEILLLESGLGNLCKVIEMQRGVDVSLVARGGAAGGTAATLHGLLNAKLVNGIDFFLKQTNFDRALSEADLVITGEGKIDDQTMFGKGPYGVAVEARKKGIPVIGVAGQIPAQQSSNLTDLFSALIPIQDPAMELSHALLSTFQNLVITCREIGNKLATNSLF